MYHRLTPTLTYLTVQSEWSTMASATMAAPPDAGVSVPHPSNAVRFGDSSSEAFHMPTELHRTRGGDQQRPSSTRDTSKTMLPVEFAEGAVAFLAVLAVLAVLKLGVQRLGRALSCDTQAGVLDPESADQAAADEVAAEACDVSGEVVTTETSSRRCEGACKTTCDSHINQDGSGGKHAESLWDADSSPPSGGTVAHYRTVPCAVDWEY